MYKQAIKNRYEFMLLVEAVMCNPNGDPDMGNDPRQDSDTERGIITAVSQKYHIRSYTEAAFDNMGILMRTGNNLNRAIAEAYMDVTGKNDLKNVATGSESLSVAQRLCDKYWDVRTFGGVLSTGRNGGQINGPVQIAMAQSVDPVTIENITITRSCYVEGDYNTLKEFDDTAAEKDDAKKRTMGEQAYIPYGLYIIKGSISASLAEKTGFSDKDLKTLWEAILQAYNHDISSSKMGMNPISPLIIFKHVGTQEGNEIQNEREAKLGCAPAQMLFRLLSVKRKDNVEYARSIDDYNISFNAAGVPDGVKVGFKYLPFKDVEWNTDNLEKYGINVI